MPDSIDIQVKQRKVYIRPEVEIVDLMPKQTVLGGCLTASNVDAGWTGNSDFGCGQPLEVQCMV
jgi:hypothetical protein